MKTHLTLLAAALALAAAAFAQKPQYVGHRGCILGVENTEMAFRNGAERFPWIECDVRMTADSTFVISHDETTERLGRNVNIPEAPLADFLNQRYIQKRGGISYEARPATLADYLKVCADSAVGAVIELKWTTGANSNDQSMMPELVKTIRQTLPDNQWLLLTSMKPCLEYMRRNYPECNIQFLGGAKWKDSLPWILENHLDVDIIHTAVTPDDIKTLHDAGLKINVWTVNDPARAADLENWGVDFITSDKLFQK